MFSPKRNGNAGGNQRRKHLRQAAFFPFLRKQALSFQPLFQLFKSELQSAQTNRLEAFHGAETATDAFKPGQVPGASDPALAQADIIHPQTVVAQSETPTVMPRPVSAGIGGFFSAPFWRRIWPPRLKW